jgi:ATPase subunit of ABC transporter with duplicated ATPase domains
VLWLEDYLESYKKTLIIVSHDRDFLNAVPTDTIYMHNKTLSKFKGNYDAFQRQYAEMLRNQVLFHALLVC